MEISSIAISNSGQLLATGQLGTIFQKLPDAPVILWSYTKKEPIAVLKGLQLWGKTTPLSSGIPEMEQQFTPEYSNFL